MTNTASSTKTYDFRNPRGLTSTTRRTLDGWCREGCTLTAERWRRLNLDVKLSYAGTQTQSLNSALASFPDPGWGVHAVVGVRSFTNIIAGSPGWLRVMTGSLFGSSDPVEDTDAPLTAIEESMAELLFLELIGAIGDAWPGAEPLETRLVEPIRRPRRTRLFAPRTTLCVLTFHIETENDSGDLWWAMPQEEIEDLIEIECTPPELPRVKPSPELSHLVCGMSVPLTVELGRTSISMSELTTLQAGDVVVLDQPSTRSLEARIGSAVKFRGRPGRLGSRRCLEIEQVFENDESSPVESQNV